MAVLATRLVYRLILRAMRTSGTLVSTGDTLAANGLVPVETVLESEAVLVRTRRVMEPPKAELAQSLLPRELTPRRCRQAVSRPPPHKRYWLFCRFRKRGMSIGSRR